MAEKKRRKQSKFRLGLKIYSSLLVFIGGLALIVLWIFLSRYQQDLNAEAARLAEQERQAAYELALERAPQLAFESYMEQADAQTWADLWLAAHPDSYDDPAQVLAVMEERFSDPALTRWKAEDYTDEHPRYVLRDGDETLARLTLSGEGLDWSVSEAEVFLEGGEDATLLVPEGYTVRCNGRVLDPGSAETETMLFDMADYADRIVDPIHWETYTVSGQLTKPVLTGEAPADRVTSVSEDGTVFYILPEDEAAVYQKRAENFIYALLRYYMLGAYDTYTNMNDALDHVMYGSQADRLIRDTYIGVIWDPVYSANTSYSATAGEVRILAENCLMVEVVYHAEGDYKEYHNIADGTYRVYFLNNGNGYGIFGLSYD